MNFFVRARRKLFSAHSSPRAWLPMHRAIFCGQERVAEEISRQGNAYTETRLAERGLSSDEGWKNEMTT